MSPFHIAMVWALLLVALSSGCNKIYPFHSIPPSHKDGAGSFAHKDGGYAAESLLISDGHLDTAPPLSDLSGPSLTSACSVGYSLAGVYNAEMVICGEATLPTNQCGAKSICNSAQGWKLCSASKFLARGGATTPSPISDDAWIASCIREQGATFAPTDLPCTCNLIGGGSMVDYRWSCDSTVSMATYDFFMGVVAHKSCYRVGENTAATAGYWLPRASSGSSSKAFAVCCKN